MKADYELIEGCKADDCDAWDELWRRYHPFICAKAAKVTGSKQEGDELVSDVFLRLRSAIRHYDHRSKFTHYLSITINNTAHDRWRAKQRRDSKVSLYPIPITVADENSCDPYLVVTSTVTDENKERLIKRLLEQVHPDRRNEIILRYYYGLTYEQIAEKESISMGTVRSRLHRGINRMKRYASHHNLNVYNVDE